MLFSDKMTHFIEGGPRESALPILRPKALIPSAMYKLDLADQGFGVSLNTRPPAP